MGRGGGGEGAVGRGPPLPAVPHPRGTLQEGLHLLPAILPSQVPPTGALPHLSTLASPHLSSLLASPSREADLSFPGTLGKTGEPRRVSEVRGEVSGVEWCVGCQAGVNKNEILSLSAAGSVCLETSIHCEEQWATG